MKKDTLYRDDYGEIWARIDDERVYNRRLGFGVWDGGRGLRIAI